MRKIYFLITLLTFLLQGTGLYAVEWLKADGTKAGPDGLYYFSTDGSYLENGLPEGTEFCRIYQTHGDYDSWNFPDATLRYRVSNAVGYTGGGTEYGTSPFNRDIDKRYTLYITKEQAKALTRLDISRSPTSGYIYNLTGIEIFENLEYLNVSGNDLSWGTVPLRILYPKDEYGNWDYDNPYHPYAGINHNELSGKYYYTDPLTQIEEERYYQHRYLGYFLRFFRNLKEVNCSDCYLYEFYAGGTDSNHYDKIETINVSNNRNLKRIDINYSKTKTLDISGCTDLITLNASYCDLEELDVTDNTNLVTLYARNNSNLSVIKHNSETQYASLKYMDFNDCNLSMIDHLELCPAIEILICHRNNLTTLDVHEDANLRQLLCSYNKLTTLDLSDNALQRLECSNNKLTSLDISGTSNKTLQYLDCSSNQLTELDVTHNTSLQTIYCYSNKLSVLDVTNNPDLQRLRISNNTNITEIDLSKNEYLEDLYCNNCKISEFNFAGPSNLKVLQASNNRLTELDLSEATNLETLFCEAQGGASVRLLKVLKLNSDKLTAVRCDNNALLSLDISNCPNLKYTGFLGNTQRSTQDLKVFDHNMVCLELPNGATGLDDDNEDPASYFHTWANSGFDIGCSEVFERDGKTYLALYNIDNSAGVPSAKADIDFYNKNISYCYYLWPDDEETQNDNGEPNEALGKSYYFSSDESMKLAGTTILPNTNRMNDAIIVKVYPYVMYVNPASQDLFAKSEGRDENNFYSGTIILEYDAIVPEGTTAYIAKNIRIAKEEIYSTAYEGEKKVVEDQMVLVKLEPGHDGVEDVVIPAFTPVYVKADTENGLFGFDRKEIKNYTSADLAKVRNDEGELVAVSEVTNILEGNVVDGKIVDLELSDADKKKYLTLGRGKVSTTIYERGEDGKITDNSYVEQQARIGFWPYTGSKIPAHRVFIRASKLDEAVVEQGTSAATSGLLFSFLDNDETTGINSTAFRTNTTSEGWYTISGIRLNERPATKGIYIHNGKKEVIR